MLLRSTSLRSYRFKAAEATRTTRMRFVSSATSSVVKKQVGFVGLGNMGWPMCCSLLAKGHAMMALDLSPDAIQRAKQVGIHTAESLYDIGNSCNIIFTMLPGCQAVHHVMPELLQSLTHPSILVDCSTVSPTTSRTWHAAAAQQGHIFVDAPVSGGVKGATEATLTFMVGSTDNEVLAKVTPYLECMGARIISCGGPGTGSATKLCNNLALATQMIGICEAMNLGESLGVDPQTLANVMNTSTAKCWSSEINNPHPEVARLGPAANDYQGGFGTNLMLKDLTLAVAAGQSVGVVLPLGAASRELYGLSALRGWGNKDFGSMLQFLRGK